MVDKTTNKGLGVWHGAQHKESPGFDSQHQKKKKIIKRSKIFCEIQPYCSMSVSSSPMAASILEFGELMRVLDFTKYLEPLFQ
jgi:hypothetical protein